MAEGKIRIKDVAKIAGVSATTVSNVIHGRTEKVSRKTRKRIEEILDEQEYAPSMGARILSGKSSGKLLLFCGYVSFTLPEADAAAESALRSGYHPPPRK